MNEICISRENISRREFIKLAGTAGLTVILDSMLASCSAEFGGGSNLIWMPPVMDYYRDTYAKAADKFGVSFAIPPIVTLIESGFYSGANSGLAKGLMQISEATALTIANRIGISDFDLFDPATNILMGTFWLSELIDKHTDLPTAVCAYYSTNRQRCVDDNYLHWVMSMFNQRGYLKSNAFETWMVSQNGGDLSLAFQEQIDWKVLDITYPEWLNSLDGQSKKQGVSSVGADSNCGIVKSPDELPDNVRVGDTVGGIEVEKWVQGQNNSHSTASGIWVEIGKPDKIEICSK